MRRFPFLLVTALCWAVLSPRVAFGQILQGKVIDQATGSGVFAVDLQLLDRAGVVRANTVSDSLGWFRFAAPATGSYKVQASRIGYTQANSEYLDVKEGVALQLELRLSTTPVAVDPLKVVGRKTFTPSRLMGYFERADWAKKSGFGRIYMRDDIESMNLFDISTLFQMSPGVTSALLTRPCTFMLDGLLIERDVIDRLVRPEEVEGVEIYSRRSQIPGEFLGKADECLAMVWSRTDPPGARPFSWKRVAFGAGVVGFFFFMLPEMRK
jgi:hypothetical protein